MKKLLIFSIISFFSYPIVFAASENPNAIVVQYPTWWTVWDSRLFDCQFTGQDFDCIISNEWWIRTLYRNTNGSLTTLFSPSNSTDVIWVKNWYILPSGFENFMVGNWQYGMLDSVWNMNVQAVEMGKIKINNIYFCLYDRTNNTSQDSYWAPRRLIVWSHSSNSSHVCPWTYEWFNLVDFYGANPYVAPDPNPCGLTQEEIDSGVTCGWNEWGWSTDWNDLPIDEESFMFYQQYKIAISGMIMAVLLFFHFFKYVRD